ncbi:hypothetical protein BZG02_10420 [Labilibaculum filiforme]|uniref:Thioredoxin domain-containing protein n=1 Tax=Labilibaculum filiforme TaxID=1940526 RepID=A0A2N3HYM5_9BACT|nr:thioredoxin family protein [Labilibaculum filiforme]PKQ63165.1 hypothetical protein BZG02_10420 [Labilibaculum filiforme]
MRKIAQLTFLLVCITILSTANSIAQSSLEEALQKAKTENKYVFVNFSGSDWCRSCILLKKTILNTEEFKKFASEKLVILDVDFPRLKKNSLSDEQTAVNEKLAAKYNSNGQFPTILLLDSNAKVMGKTGYKKVSPKDYVSHIQSIIAQ